MKRILTLVTLISAITASSYASNYLDYLDFDISRRIYGMNPALSFIVSDEYTDFMSVNSANILDVDGKRVYTQLSNFEVSGYEHSGYDLNLGGVMPVNDMGNIGAFLSLDRTKNASLIRYFVATSANAGEFTNDPQVVQDLRTTPDSTHWGFWGPFGEREGKYDFELIDEEGIVERESGEAFNDTLSLSFDMILGLEDVLPFGDLGLRLGYNSYVVHNADLSYSYLYENENDPDDFLVQDYSANAKGGLSIISVAPSIRGIQVGDWDLGTTLELHILNRLGEYGNESDMKLGSSHDESYSEQGQSGTYERMFRRDEQNDGDGIRMGIMFNSKYPLRDDLNFKFFTGFRMMKMTGGRESSEHDEITDTGNITGIVEEYNKTQSFDLEITGNEMIALGGIEKQMSENLLIGAGVGLGRIFSKDIEEEGRDIISRDDVIEYSKSIIKETMEQSNSALILPAGFEWKATEWLRARFGLDYLIVAVKETTTKETQVFESGDKDADIERLIVNKTTGYDSINSYANFYSGIGIDFNDNLTLDLSGYGWGGRIFNMESWQVSATFKF